MWYVKNCPNIWAEQLLIIDFDISHNRRIIVFIYFSNERRTHTTLKALGLFCKSKITTILLSLQNYVYILS